MATLSVIAAAEALYASLNPALFPGSTLTPYYFDRAVEVANNVEVQPPYCIIHDLGMVPAFDFELNITETTSLSFDVVANTLADVDTIVEAIKYNGGNPTAPLSGKTPGAGFDFGVLSTLASNYANLKIIRTGERRSLAGRNAAGGRTHMCKLDYVIQLERTS